MPGGPGGPGPPTCKAFAQATGGPFWVARGGGFGSGGGTFGASRVASPEVTAVDSVQLSVTGERTTATTFRVFGTCFAIDNDYRELAVIRFTGDHDVFSGESIANVAELISRGFISSSDVLLHKRNTEIPATFNFTGIDVSGLSDDEILVWAAAHGTSELNRCDVEPGIDLFTTPPGGTTSSSFSEMPIPPGFFGPGSDPFVGTIIFTGQPIDPSPSSPLGPTDTIVRRLETASLPGPNSSATIPIEIVGLSLVSVTPITVTYDGGANPEQWNVHTCLSRTVPQQQGTMTITAGRCPCPTGGSFSSKLKVLPRLVFTRVVSPTVRELDFGVHDLPPVEFAATDAPWLPFKPAENVITVSPGLFVDHDCDASTLPLGPLPGSSNFFPGGNSVRCHPGACDHDLIFEPRCASTPFEAAGDGDLRPVVVDLGAARGPDAFAESEYQMTSTTLRILPHLSAVYLHGVLLALYCVAGDHDGDGMPDDADNCPESFNPLQEDADRDGVGDGCDNCEIVNPCQEDLNHNGIGDWCEPADVAEVAPDAVMLSPPVPNPVTGSFSYGITLPRASWVKVRVYDVGGRLVRNVVSRMLPAGRHTMTWNPGGGADGGGLQSGSYYLRLDAAGFQKAQRFVVIR